MFQKFPYTPDFKLFQYPFGLSGGMLQPVVHTFQAHGKNKMLQLAYLYLIVGSGKSDFF